MAGYRITMIPTAKLVDQVSDKLAATALRRAVCASGYEDWPPYD
jgi:hypothetical protein